MNLTPGTVLQNGKYVLEAPLGQGGFGTTYRANHTYLGQTVVLKTLNESLRHHANFAQFQQQFIGEARRLAKCQHPNIVRVLDFFEEDGLSFFVMDYIPGQTLAEVIESSGKPLPEMTAIHYVRQIGWALSVIHQNGLLHRDVKPQNIIRRQGTDFVVLIDFGIAREFTPGVTQTHTGMLSAGYAPIEQYLTQGKRTPATDIYALAATLYCLLTGQPPIAAPLRDRIPLPSIRDFQPNLSPVVERAVMRGIELEDHLRPQSVEEWLSLLPKSSAPAPAHSPEPEISVPIASVPGHAPQSQSHNGQPTTVGTTATGATLPLIPRPTPLAAPPSTPAPTAATVAPPAPASPSQQLPRPVIPRRSPTPKWLPRALIMTSAIAALGGIGFGLALRLGGATSPGSSIFHTDQSFPPLRDWPGTSTEPTPAPVPEERTFSTPDNSQPIEPLPTTPESLPSEQPTDSFEAEPIPNAVEPPDYNTEFPGSPVDRSTEPAQPIDPVPTPAPVNEAPPAPEPVTPEPLPPTQTAPEPPPVPQSLSEPPLPPPITPSSSEAPAPPL